MQRKIEFIRKVDKNGRIVLPGDIRYMYGMEEGTDLYILALEENVFIRRAEPTDLL